MAKKKSPSQIAAELEYYRQNNIQIPEKQPRSKVVVVHEPTKEGVTYGLTGNIKDFGIYIEGINKSKPLKYMNDRQIIEKLIEDYSIALNYIIKPEMMVEPVKIREYLVLSSMSSGICAYSRIQIGVAIADRWWITQYEGDRFWFQTTRNVYTSKEMINCISLRVNRLTEILNSLE